ncbi:MAG TPA: aspartate aminotransferase family protein [Thermodesulfobacteriota bacterium]|nr:aspartate aminotransferase family protein [Thermodesulfobacteriota bacterium]
MTDDIIKRARAHLTPALVFHTDIVMKKAEGIHVESADGKRYMDFTSGLAVANAGHCPPEVVAAAVEQTKRFIHSGCIFRYDSEIELAERLSGITPEGIEMFFFSNSGAEAVEGAIKLARYATGRQGIIAFTGGFHGRTMGAVTLTSSSARYRKRYHPLLPSVYHAPYPYCYRCPMGKTRSTCVTDCFGYLKEGILRHHIAAEEVACVIIEPVLGEGGYVVPPADYIEKLRKLCTDSGILLIADEVQSGFGRTARWFASEHFNLRPDIVTMAKAMASGFPLSAVGSTKELMGRWDPGAHGTTFGGNPVACAAAVATIEKIKNDWLLENAEKTGRYAMERLRSIASKNSSIGDVRGLGLMIGVEFVRKDGSPDTEGLKKVMARCREKGLIIIECGTEKNIARLMPPLVVTQSEMEMALDIFEEALV